MGTAGLFAKKGYDVTVLEKNANLGGRANIFEADGFKFDMGPSWYLAPDLFEHFAAVAQRLGVYTVRDYAAILTHLIQTWGIGKLSASGKAARAQEYLCGLPAQYEKLAERVGEDLGAAEKVKFSWIDGRAV